MKKVLFLFLTIWISNGIFGQIKSCEDCHNVMYRTVDIEKNTSEELELLRNEIFARKGYIFKDKEKSKYFKQFDWYQPTIKDEKSIELNDVETDNIRMFLKKENRIKKYNKNAVKDLKSIKKALKQQNVEKTLSCLNGKISIQSAGFERKVKRLKGILQDLDLNDIHWYRDQAIHKVKVDNGLEIIETSLRIDQDGIVVAKQTIGPSSLIELEPEEEFDDNVKPKKISEWKFKLVGSTLKLQSIHEVLK